MQRGRDVRDSRTFLMLADPMGRPRSGIVTMPTARDPRRFVAALAVRIRQLLETDAADAGKCEGIGVVVPGMVDSGTSRVLHAPTLGWRNVDLLDRLAAATESRCTSRTPAGLRAGPGVGSAAGGRVPMRNLVFVSVSDGVGVGIVVNGEVLRGGTTSPANSRTCRWAPTVRGAPAGRAADGKRTSRTSPR
jgi:predicted NBD/HSP70 family sugar kinase